MDEKEELQYLRQQNKKLKQENRELSSKLAVTEAAKKEKDVIGLHYLIDQKMNVHKQMLEGGVICYNVEVGMQETISRSDTSQPTSCNYRVSALINQDLKIVQMEITKL